MFKAGMFKAVIDGNDGFFDEVGGVNLNLMQVTAKGNSILHVAAKSGNAQITKGPSQSIHNNHFCI